MRSPEWRCERSDCETNRAAVGQQDLLRVDSRLTLAPGQTIDSQIWLNEQGEIVKSVVPALRQTTYRVTRDQALGASPDRENSTWENSQWSALPTRFPPHTRRRGSSIASLCRRRRSREDLSQRTDPVGHAARPPLSRDRGSPIRSQYPRSWRQSGEPDRRPIGVRRPSCKATTQRS